MQTSSRFLTLILAIAVVAFSSCGKSNKQGRYIPENAAIAVVVNGESLSAKLPWSEIKQTEWFKLLYNDSTLDAFVKSALDNPDNTGIDTKKDLIFFAVKDSAGGYIAFEGTIKDEAAFKKFVTQVYENDKAESKDGMNYLSKNDITASWKDGMFVVAGNAPMMNQDNLMKELGNAEGQGPAISKSRDMVSACQQVYALKEDKSLAKDDKMSDLMKSKGDMHFWMNTEALYSGSLSNAALSMMNISKLYKGSYTTGVVNFDNGQINMDFKSYSGKEMTELTKKYNGSSLNKDMIGKMPSKNVVFFLSMNFKPEGVREFLKLAGLDGFANMGSAFLGFNVDDFVKANKGDIAFCITDVRTDSMGRPDASFMFTASIGDQSAFDKLIAAGKKIGKEEMGGQLDSKIFYGSNKNYFAIGNQQADVNGFVGAAKTADMPFMNKIGNNPIGMYMDIQQMIKGFGASEMNRDSLSSIAYQATLNMWQDVLMSGGKLNDGAVEQHVEINLVDKNTNSLKLLNKYINVLVDIENKKKAQYAKLFEESDFSDEPVVVAEP